MSGVTGVDVEHTKARLSEIRKQMDLVRSFGISIGPSTPWELITIATALVAAVERVQALHTPINAADYGVRNRGAITQVCTGCGQDDGNWQYWPCPTIRALETQ